MRQIVVCAGSGWAFGRWWRRVKITSGMRQDRVIGGSLTVVTAGCSVGVRAVPALAVGLIGWLFVIGFVVNDGRVLRLTGVGISAALSCCSAWRRGAPWPAAIFTRS